MTIVVVGGGIVGLTAAYYLSRRGHKVTVVEKCSIACHSSGKAGGFLTDGDSGWHRGPIAGLARHSFKLHQELAQEFGAERIGYRSVKCVTRGDGREKPPDWLSPSFKTSMGDQTGMAQVSPRKLMDALAAAVSSQGCDVLIAKAVGVETEADKVKALKVLRDGQEVALPCDALVLAMGAWARDAAPWFPDSVMPKDTVSHRYTSVIWDDVEVGKDATMVFVSDAHDVEIYPRADECYANGCPTSTELPDNPEDIVPPADTIENVKAETISVVERLSTANVLRSTACFLPGSEDNKPVVGLVPKMKNAVIACGGGCWGILNGPAMGQAAAAIATGEEPAVSLEAFRPERFEALAGGLPPQLLALIAQNPGLAAMIRENPALALQLLKAQQGGRDGD